jgi:hypothetical protein
MSSTTERGAARESAPVAARSDTIKFSNVSKDTTFDGIRYSQLQVKVFGAANEHERESPLLRIPVKESRAGSDIRVGMCEKRRRVEVRC